MYSDSVYVHHLIRDLATDIEASPKRYFVTEDEGERRIASQHGQAAMLLAGVQARALSDLLDPGSPAAERLDGKTTIEGGRLWSSADAARLFKDSTVSDLLLKEPHSSKLALRTFANRLVHFSLDGQRSSNEQDLHAVAILGPNLRGTPELVVATIEAYTRALRVFVEKAGRRVERLDIDSPLAQLVVLTA